MELKIYDKANNLRLTASPNTSSSVTEEIGGECSVSASFTHTEYVPLDVDDYIELESVRYKVKSRYRPKQKNTQTYEYSVKFYAPIHDAEDTLMLFQEGGTTSEFSYDGGPREHLQLWIDNMNRRAGGNLWSIGTVITADNKTIDYRNVKCWDAAFGSNGIAATFGTEMWADGYAINLCKAERGEMVELGYLQGLTNLAQEDNGEVKFFTRLFPLGSTRNIDATKYGYSRLQLPDRSLYVDKNVDLYGVKEETEETAFSEIYPKYIGTISSVRSEEKENEEGQKYTVYYFKDNGMNWNPKDYEIPDLDYMLKFQTGELAGRGTDGSFQTAWHEDTREWEIINVYPDDTTQIPGGAIIPQPGDQYIPWNFAMPQEYITEAEQEYKQAVDDYLNTYSFDPNKYTGTTDRNYIEKNHTPLRIGWNVRLLSEQYFGTTGGYKDTRVTKVQRKLNDLCQATITCSDEVGTAWKSSVDNSLNSLRYEVAKQAEQKQIDVLKTSDSKTPSDYNVFSALRSLYEIIKKAEELEEKLLHKDKPDITDFLLCLVGGAEFGQYASGISGGKIDEKGAAELLSLSLRGALTIGEYKKGLKGANIDKEGVADLLSILVRSGIESANFSTGALGAGFCLKKDENGDSYLEVDRMLVRKVATFIQLLIQQIKHVGGQIILTPASMSCVKVEDKGDYYRCYFENTDGERTIEQEFVVGDLARAQTFNVKEGVNDNVTNTYYWRAVVGTGDNYIDLSKTDCDADSTVPKAGDDIVQLGNKSDATRQAAIILSAYGNDAPYFKLYRGINSYSLDGKEFVSFSRSEVMIIADTIRFTSGETIEEYINNVTGGLVVDVETAKKAAEEAQKAAAQASAEASEAVERLDKWASDGIISPTEKQSLKDEIARIDADKTQVSNGYAKYNLGTPTDYNNAHTAYRAVLVTLTASTPETISIPSDFATKQTAYYTQRTNALTAISDAARDYAQGIANDLSSYKKTVSSQFEQTNNSITAAVTSSKEYTNTKVGEVNTSLTEYKKEVTSKFSVLEGEISSKVSSSEITTIKQEILNTAASDATTKANNAKNEAISTAASDATNKANQAKNDAIATAGSNADKKYATITTVSSMQTSITQLSNSLSLKAEKSEVTAVQNNLDKTNSNLSSLTTRVSEAEIALQPDNIWIGISSKVTTTTKKQNIVPDSCFDDANYSMLYNGGSRVSAATANNSCPTSYCLKSSQRDITVSSFFNVSEGEKYYISAYINASQCNYSVMVGLGLVKSNSSEISYWIWSKSVTAKTSGWQKVEGYITIPSGYSRAKVYACHIEATSNFGTAYVTKLYCYKVDESVNQNYALLTSTEKKLTTFSNISNQTWSVYNITGLKKGDIITVSFEYEASNLNFNTTTEHTAKINCQFGSLYGWAGTTFDLKSNGSGKYISKPITIGGTATETNETNIFFRLDYISSVLQNGSPIGYFRVWKMKVEKGERSTPWSAAPSDYSTTEEIKAGMQITDKGFNFFGQEFNFSGRISVGDLDPTIIEDGYLRASLINADTLVVKTLNASNTDGVSTLVNKDGMKMTQGSNELFKLTSNKATVGTTRYYAQMDLTTVYSDGSTLQGTLTPESLFLRGKTKSTDKTLKTTLMYNGLMVYDENGTGLTVNTKGIQLTYCGRTQGGSDVCSVVHYAKCIFSAYITASGYLNSSIGGSIPNSSGTPIEFSVSKTGTGTYKVTHNIGDIRYHVQVSPIRGTYFPVACVRERQTTYFVYTTAYNAPSGGVYGLTDGDCAVFVNVYYESPLLFTF